MPHKHIKPSIKVPGPVSNKVRGYLKVSMHLLSGYSLECVYRLYNRYNITVLSNVGLGGILSKRYLIHIEGYRGDITKLNRLVNRY